MLEELACREKRDTRSIRETASYYLRAHAEILDTCDRELDERWKKIERAMMEFDAARSSSAVTDISGACEERWGEDQKMIEHCSRKQTNARQSLERMSISPEIRDQCFSKWDTDYAMVKHCVEKLESAKEALRLMSASTEVRQLCEDKWGDDYTMVKYCIEKQSEAKASLGFE